jgi:predicted nucleic acid-binding protein
VHFYRNSAIAAVHRLFAQVRPLTAPIHGRAMDLARDQSLSFYDALMVAAALDADCDVLFSEDLQHGRAFGGLEVVNPF